MRTIFLRAVFRSPSVYLISKLLFCSLSAIYTKDVSKILKVYAVEIYNHFRLFCSFYHDFENGELFPLKWSPFRVDTTIRS